LKIDAAREFFRSREQEKLQQKPKRHQQQQDEGNPFRDDVMRKMKPAMDFCAKWAHDSTIEVASEISPFSSQLTDQSLAGSCRLCAGNVRGEFGCLAMT
jgi:hypothetical protein